MWVREVLRPHCRRAASVLSCLIQSKLARRGLFSYRSLVNKDSSVGHSCDLRRERRAAKTGPGLVLCSGVCPLDELSILVFDKAVVGGWGGCDVSVFPAELTAVMPI